MKITGMLLPILHFSELQTEEIIGVYYVPFGGSSVYMIDNLNAFSAGSSVNGIIGKTTDGMNWNLINPITFLISTQ